MAQRKCIDDVRPARHQSGGTGSCFPLLLAVLAAYLLASYFDYGWGWR